MAATSLSDKYFHEIVEGNKSNDLRRVCINSSALRDLMLAGAEVPSEMGNLGLQDVLGDRNFLIEELGQIVQEYSSLLSEPNHISKSHFIRVISKVDSLCAIGSFADAFRLMQNLIDAISASEFLESSSGEHIVFPTTQKCTLLGMLQGALDRIDKTFDVPFDEYVTFLNDQIFSHA